MRVSRPLTLLLLMGSLHSLAAPVVPRDLLNLIPASPAGQNLLLSEQQAQQSFAAAQAALGLKVTAGGNYSINTTDFSSTQQSGSVNLGVSLPVLPWGTAFDSLKNAERTYKTALLDAQDARNALISKVIGGYYSILLADQDLNLAKQNQTLAEAQLQVAQQQKVQGTLTQEALLQAQQKVSTAQLGVLKAQNALDFARATLAGTLGMRLPEGEYTAAVLNGFPQRTLEEWNTLALSKRSDIQKATLKLQAAQDALNQAVEDRWRPSGTLSTSLSSGGFGADVSLNVQTGVLSSSASYALQDSTGAGGYRFSLSASIPIVDGSQDASIRAGQLALQSAQAAVETTRQTALLDVAQKFSSVQLAQLQVQNSMSALNIAREHLNVTEARVKAGLSTALELTSAQISVAQAENDRTAADVALLNAILELMNAAGEPYRGGAL